ncbi:hypothetical protein [Paenibacillus sp. R14(2021)]|uniref:hypothetical protein n=1 Tax=Paenibacillus sp. R14(2021) TaxID=2859228 RepID=UPI002156F844|nr:hypothetical protein [Paenibacillus sp. R14(2021)]
MVESPDVPLPPYRHRDGMNWFELAASPVRQELLPGRFIHFRLEPVAGCGVRPLAWT